MKIELIPLLEDNYAYLLIDEKSKKNAVVDPSEAKPVISLLKQKDLQLDYIFNTHHHWDHTDGNDELKQWAKNCQVVGPKKDAARIPAIDIELEEGDGFHFGEYKAQIFDVPGHTKGAIAFYFSEIPALFSGDTLFSLGCGYLFEGTPEQMWHSLCKLRNLPDETLLYCGHEYTVRNSRFALALDSGNKQLQAFAKEVEAKVSQGLASIPSKLSEEKICNPFLRADHPDILAKLQKGNMEHFEVFARVRELKTQFDRSGKLSI